MHRRISVGAAFNILHSVNTIRKKHRRSIKIFDEFTGKITGVNINGIKVLDLFAKGNSFFKISILDSIHMQALIFFWVFLISRTGLNLKPKEGETSKRSIHINAL